MKKTAEKRKGIVTVIALFAVFSAILLGTAWYACSLAPNMIVRNYRTVKYVAEMQSSLTAIYLDAANGKVPEPKEITRFEENLKKQKDNITELQEPEVTASIEEQWTVFSKQLLTPPLESFKKLGLTLEELASLNENAMFAYEQQARSMGKAVLFGGVLGFLLVMIYAVQIVIQQDS